MFICIDGSDRHRLKSLQRRLIDECVDVRRCLTRNNLAVTAMLLGLGFYVYESNQPGGSSAGDYMVALWGTEAEKTALVNDLARRQNEQMHLTPISAERFRLLTNGVAESLPADAIGQSRSSETDMPLAATW